MSSRARRLSGKVALVTGGSRGIGAAVAKELAGDGAKVVVNFVENADAASSVVSEIKESGGEACAIQADISRVAPLSGLVAGCVRQYGMLNVLVNNAAISEGATLDQICEEQFDRHVATNLKAALFLSQAAVRVFPPQGGVIINVSSIGTRAANPRFMVYSATKAALEMLTVTMSRDLGPKGIRVNAVAPGQIDTEMLRRNMSTEVLRSNIERTSLGRLGRSEDIAHVVSFLASDDAGWITGETIHVNGGQRL
jgi:3-oxoacyl-[acyl-carrier protein] reductase